MRDLQRIPKILSTLERIWQKNPDLRLTQLLVIAAKPKDPCPQIFYNFHCRQNAPAPMKLGELLICTIILILIFLGCQKAGEEYKMGEEFTSTESGLQYQILQEGSGPGATG